MLHRRTVLLIAALGAACAAPSEPAPPASLAAEGDTPTAPLQTDQRSYTIRSTGNGLAVDIPFRYRNETGKTVYVANCNRIAPPSLEQRQNGQWVRAWSAAVPACLSPPIEIAPGATYADTLQVFAGLPNSDVYPKFDVPEPAGTYRLVWHGLVHDYDANRQGFGTPLPLDARVSNEFGLKR